MGGEEANFGNGPALPSLRVTIVGLGLMGGSLALALRDRVGYLCGVDRDEETLAQALRRGIVDWATADLAAGVRDAQVVILATPVRVILDLLPRLGGLLSPGCALLDLGSTKAAILQAMARLPSHLHPIGGHPMCGRERSGLAAAEATLYEGCTFVLIPLARTPPTALGLAQRLVQAVGARPLVMDGSAQEAGLRHDRLVAAISHLPYALAVALAATAQEVGAADPLLWALAASGFRDTSRLAGSDVTMMTDILLTNRGAVLEMLDRAQAHLDALREKLLREDEHALRSWLASVRAHRSPEAAKSVL